MIRETVTIDATPSIIQMETGETLNIFLVAAIIAILVILMELADRITIRCIMTILKTTTSNKNKS